MKIAVIGSGNVATHLAKGFYQLGHTITQIVSRHIEHASALAHIVQAEAAIDPEKLASDADLYLIAVSDSAIGDIICSIPAAIQGLVIHTSGATPLTALNKFNRYGVIYPPQSISKAVDIDLSTIPFAIEANNNENTTVLLKLMQGVSAKTFCCNSEQRLALHVAAVLANNFPNALFQAAAQILEDQHLDIGLLRPIILETAQKVQHHHPKDVQTGPAVRNDINTINRHLQFLSYSDELTEIYQNITDFIIKRRQK